MAVVARRQPSALVSNGLSVATVALNVVGAAADAVPIAKQILNSAAHISTAAERIQKKREALYLLVEKAEIYAKHIDIAVAGRIIDTSLQRRLARLYSVFLKIEALVDAKADSKSPVLARLWQNVVTRPNRAETLVVELEREIQLFQARSYHVVSSPDPAEFVKLLTQIQLSLVVDDTARAVDDSAHAVAADVRYDGQFRVLRDCDIEKRDIIAQCPTDQGRVVWASARVDGQLMMIRYLDSSSAVKSDRHIEAGVVLRHARYHEYLEDIKKMSTLLNSYSHIVQFYGLHFQSPCAVFRAGTLLYTDYLDTLRLDKGYDQDAAVKRLRLAYKVLDASSYLADAHGLVWLGTTSTVDENGEPQIGLFDDIVRDDPKWPYPIPFIYYTSILIRFTFRSTEETGVLEQVHNSYLHAIITKQLHHRNGTARLQQLWDAIRQERLYVYYGKCVFPITGDISLPPEMIARARQRYLQIDPTSKDIPDLLFHFMRDVLVGGANMSSRIHISIRGVGDDYDKREIDVEACTRDDRHIQYDRISIAIRPESPLLAVVARALGLPGDTWTNDWRDRTIYQRVEDAKESCEEVTVSLMPECLVLECSTCTDDEGEAVEDLDEHYETAEEGEGSCDGDE